MATFHIDSILAPKDQQIIPTTIYVHMTEGSSTRAMGQCSELQPKVWKSQTCSFHSNRERTKEQLIGDQMPQSFPQARQKSTFLFVVLIWQWRSIVWNVIAASQQFQSHNYAAQNVTKCLQQQAADYKCSYDIQLTSSTVGGKQNYNKVLQLCIDTNFTLWDTKFS